MQPGGPIVQDELIDAFRSPPKGADAGRYNPPLNRSRLPQADIPRRYQPPPVFIPSRPVEQKIADRPDFKAEKLGLTFPPDAGEDLNRLCQYILVRNRFGIL
jgi:hypothetical protein